MSTNETVPTEPQVTTTRPAPAVQPRRQPRYAVVVYDDNLHTFPYVILALSRICGHPFERATELANRIHNTGRALVWTGALEVAELKRDQLRAFGPDHFGVRPVRFPLGVDIEPVA